MKGRRRLAVAAGLAAAALLASLTAYLVLSSPQPSPTSPETALLNAAKTEDLATLCPALAAGDDPYYGTRQRAKLRKQLEDAASMGYPWLVGAHIAVARDHLRFGETDEAVNVLKQALEADPGGDIRGIYRSQLLEELSVVYLKMGELDNCLSPEGALICMLPLDTSVAQTDTEGSESAVAVLTELLEMQPDNIRARWLLNIAHMTLGTYPSGVPEDYLVPPSRLRGDYNIGRFEDISARAGLYSVTLAGGSIVDDFDNDGLLDIMTSTWDPCGSMAYYHNDGNGSFSDYTSRAGLSGQLGGLNMVQADYDNDGWMDALVMRGGWMRENGRIRMSLLRNNADGTFSDVTVEAGLSRPSYPSQSAAWADYDNDGDVDLFSCNESEPVRGYDLVTFDVKFPSQLFRNNGDGTFTDVAKEAGVTNLRYCKGSAWGDFDGDGDPDLYVSNYAAENRLYRNDGQGVFTDVAADLGVTEPRRSFATWFWDYDNDGLLDLFVAGYGPRLARWRQTTSACRTRAPGRVCTGTSATPGSSTSPARWVCTGSTCQWARTSATSITTGTRTSIWGPDTQPSTPSGRTSCTGTKEGSRSRTSPSPGVSATFRRATALRSETSTATGTRTSSCRWAVSILEMASPTHCSRTPATAAGGSRSAWRERSRTARESGRGFG